MSALALVGYMLLGAGLGTALGAVVLYVTRRKTGGPE